MKTRLLICGLLFTLCSMNAQRFFLNKVWQTSGANPGANEQIGCGVSPNGNFIYFTNTKPGSNCDLSLNCVTPNGTLTSISCTSCPVKDDFGSDVAFDAVGNMYVCGARGNGNDLDYYVAKYSPTGSIIWSKVYNHTVNKDDVAADIEVDASGNVYVTGTSYGGLLTDIATIKYDNSGNQIWVKRYDFSGLPEVATNMKLDASGNVFVCGTGFNSANDADFIVIKYDPAGNQTGFHRNTNIGFGYDVPSEMVIDASNRVFIVGTCQNGNKDIKTVAYTNSLSPLWAKVINKAGMNDEGFGITVASSSEIVVTGYSTKLNGGTELVVMKYNSANGNNVAGFPYTKSAPIETQIAKGRKIKKDNLGNLVVAGEIDIQGKRHFYVIGLNQNGQPVFERNYNNGFGNNSARNMDVTTDNKIFVTGIADNGSSKEVTSIMLEEDGKTDVPTGTPYKFIDDELIIQFDPDALIKTPFLRKDIQFGTLKAFVTSDVIQLMNQRSPIEGGWENAKARKLYPEMTMADSVSLNRDSIWILQRDFWPTLVVDASMPNEKTTGDSLAKILPFIRYAETNGLNAVDLTTTPNDPQYLSGNQSGLNNASYGINLPFAWNYTNGTPNIKIGVFDSGINFNHEDMGGGTFATSKVKGGKDYTNSGVQISSLTTPDDKGHGSNVSGIIGALANNGKGVSGVAGGDMAVSNMGCSLYAMKISNLSGFASDGDISNAIIEGVSYNPITGFGYGQHITNHSWGTTPNNTPLSLAANAAYRNSSILVAAAGNHVPMVTGNCPNISCILFPGSYTDDYVIKVGAVDDQAQKASFSVEGNGLDVVAPGTSNIVTSLSHSSNTGYVSDNGTSFASPHVAGVVGLMMSVHNPSIGAQCNLAPEDVEHLIQLQARDIDASGYDNKTGHGIINAGATVSSIVFPRYRIEHPVHSSAIPISGPTNFNIVLANPVNGLAAGVYTADREQINFSYVVILPPTYYIQDWWVRWSSVHGYDGQNPVSGQTGAFVGSPFISGSIFQMNASVFCWYVKNQIGSFTPINKWIPSDPSTLRFAFSVYAYDPSSAIGVDEKYLFDSKIETYPNPTQDKFNISYVGLNEENLNIEIVDAVGKVIAKQQIITKGQTSNEIVLDLSYLSNGVYFCKLYSGKYSTTRKFVKLD